MYNWMIFTDLDGTLLDHDDYSFNLALPALQKVKRLNIPLIINSSKTFAEVDSIRQKMHNHWAFSVENGAAVFLPNGELSGTNSRMEQFILGKPQVELLNIIHRVREQGNFLFKGFNDFTVEELVLETGLTTAEAILAKQRLASEPIKWLDSVEQFTLFKQQLEGENLQLIQGGRFLHVMGKNDKGLSMAWILNKFTQQQKVQTIAIGDSDNDSRMLELADYAGVIRKVDGSYLNLDKQAEQIIYSQHQAPLGWQEVVDYLVDNIILGDTNE